MTICNIIELKNIISENQRILALDLGEKIIGLALSDLTKTIATPYGKLNRKKFSVTSKFLMQIIEKENVGAVIIGFPLNMDGSIGPSAQSARDFAVNFTKVSSLAVAIWDERLSTVAVERTMIEADLSRKKRSKIVDKLAATFILQGALDFISTSKPSL